MAYNPFNIFRRNQKVIFAVVTVFIMFTFVLSSGLGGGSDFFDWLPRWLGSKGKRGDAVATLDGTKIYDGDLTEAGRGLRYQRVMANRFMGLAAEMTVQRLESTVAEQLNRMSPEARQQMGQILQQERQMLQQERLLRDPQFAGIFAEARQRIRDDVRRLANSPTAKPEDREVARAKLASLMLQDFVGEHYFRNAPNRTQRDLIDFMLWQKKADQLGIRFTPDDVKALVQREFFGSMPSDVPIQRAMRDGMPNFTMDAVLKAIGEEFRVRAAQMAVLGPEFTHGERGDKTYGGSPVFATPAEAFEYFVNEVSPTTYAVIPVPAEKFLAAVPDPDENDPKVREELRNLYRQYKDAEPDPGRETPGFKTPRRVTVGWLKVTGDEPYFVARAEEGLKRGEVAAKVGTLLTVPLFGTSPAEVAAAAAPVGAKDALLEAAYKRLVVDKHASEVDIRWGKSSAFDALGLLLDTSVVRPGNLAVASGAVGGQLLAFGNPYAAAAATGTGPIAYEIRDRVKAGVPAVLAALGTDPRAAGELRVWGFSFPKPPVAAPLPGPGMWNAVIGAAVAYDLMTPKPVPLDAHRPTLMQDLVAQNARRLAAEDVRAFLKETAKLSENGRAKDKGPVEKYIREFAAQRGLTVHGTADPRTEWTLEQDPALAPLVAAQKESLKSAGGPHGGGAGPGYVPFGQRFFWAPGASGRNPAQGTYVAANYPTDVPTAEDDLKAKGQYVVWRTREEPAAPRAEAAAWADVKLAWKRAKARERAKAKADELAEAIRKSGAESEWPLIQNVEDAAAKLGVEPFLVRGVAPLTTVADPTAGKGPLAGQPLMTMPGELRQFQIRPSENVKYPTNEFARALMEDRTKGPKHAAVFPDAPKDTYFVAVPVKREVKTESDYKFEVAGGEMSQRFGGPLVLGMFRQQAREKAYRSVMGLLKQEFGYVETDEQKKKLDENERRGEV